MQTFYLTPTAISDLTLFIFAALIAGYLAYLVWRVRAKQPALPVLSEAEVSQPKRPYQTLTLTLAFAAISGYILLDFLNQTLYPDLAFTFLPLQSVFMALSMVCLVQFAYRMPEIRPQWRRESRLALGLTLLLALWELGYAGYRCAQLREGIVAYRPPNADFVTTAVFIWIVTVFLRQAVLAAQDNPQSRDARAARRMALISLLPVGLTAVLLLQGKSDLPTTAANTLLSMGLMLTMLLFALVYLNYLPEQTSFMLRLSAITLAFFLAVLGAVGQAMTPSFVAAYHNPNLIAAPQTLRFTPNAEVGYDIAQIPYAYEPFDVAQDKEELGEQLAYGEEYYAQLPLDFEFPFYDQRWSELTMNRDGFVTFGKTIRLVDTQFHYGSAPSIYLMGTNFENNDLIERPGRMYAHGTPNQLTLTWLEMPEYRNLARKQTLQLRLYESGVFDMTVVKLPAAAPYDIDDRWYTARMVGALPGMAGTQPDYIRFNDNLPFSGGANGVVEDYHLDFRTALHNFLTPLFWLTLFSGLLVPLGLALTLRQDVVRPLHNLLAGVRQADGGDLNINIPIHVEDEFGYLTHAFNKMAAELNAHIAGLEDRVTERTAQLTENAAQLADTIDYLNNILRNAGDYAIITVDRDLSITYVNPMAETLYNITAAEAIGQPVTIIAGQKVNPEQFEAGLHHAAARGIHQYAIAEETTAGTRHIAARLSGMFDEQGELIGYAHFSQDVSQRVHAESQLLTQQRAIAVLEDRAQIGQELHDRLGQVFGFLSLQSQAAQALFAAGKRDDGDRTLARLAVVAQDAHGQVREFILGMRGGAAGSQNFWDALQAYGDKLQSLYQMRVTLRLHGLPAERARLLPPDKELHLLRLIQEALTNAQRHSGVNQAQVSFWQDGATVRVTIADDGRGFEPPAFPIAHRPFSETLALSQLEQPEWVDENGRQHFGLLGMYEHAAALGGTLEIRSRPSAGTQISLAFPLDPEGETAAEELAGLTNTRVLLVDDQPIFLEGLSNLLTAYGLQVVGMARDGLQAQALARTTRPDVIVMDIYMPVCDGITAVRNIKKEFPDIDIVMLSVSAEDETLFEALRAGASGYLLKSMQAKDFFLLISGLADGAPPMAPELAGKVLAEFRSRLQTDVTLTDEQTRLLHLIAEGLTYFQISLELDMSERTVQRQMKKILELLHLSNRTEAEAYARRQGL